MASIWNPYNGQFLETGYYQTTQLNAFNNYQNQMNNVYWPQSTYYTTVISNWPSHDMQHYYSIGNNDCQDDDKYRDFHFNDCEEKA